MIFTRLKHIADTLLAIKCPKGGIKNEADMKNKTDYYFALLASQLVTLINTG